MHFRILRMIATSGFLTALECTKFDFGRALPRPPESPAPAGDFTAYAPPNPLAGLKGTLLKRKGKGGEEREGKGREGEMSGGEEKKRREGERMGSARREGEERR